ncbi:hypothetical protein AB0C52_21545 [Streptomyces sp. NPDC048717]|uniref:hypothetical protein n=1 Tax=Streptomyces sp. NPDC048717 TaxID=3154928 RepID=UPI003442857C
MSSEAPRTRMPRRRPLRRPDTRPRPRPGTHPRRRAAAATVTATATATGSALAAALLPVVVGALLTRSAGGDPMASVNALIAGGGQRARLPHARLSGARLSGCGGRVAARARGGWDRLPPRARTTSRRTLRG